MGPEEILQSKNIFRLHWHNVLVIYKNLLHKYFGLFEKEIVLQKNILYETMPFFSDSSKMNRTEEEW